MDVKQEVVKSVQVPLCSGEWQRERRVWESVRRPREVNLLVLAPITPNSLVCTQTLSTSRVFDLACNSMRFETGALLIPIPFPTCLLSRQCSAQG